MSKRTFSWVLAVFLLGVAGSCKKQESVGVIEHTGQSAEEVTLVYTSDRTGKLEIWSRSKNGESQLTNSAETDSWWPRATADGKKILYYSSESGRDMNDYASASLRVLNIETSESKEVLGVGATGWHMHGLGDWSDAGDIVVMSVIENEGENWQLYIVDSHGANPRKISARSTGNYLDPAFSPDGEWVYCSAILEGDSSENYQLFRIHLESGSEEQLSSNGKRNHHPHVSGDGKKLVYETLEDPDYLGMGRWAIRQMDIESGAESVILESENSFLHPRLSPEGEKLYVIQLSVESFSLELVEYSIPTRDQQTLTEPGINVYSVDCY